MGTPGYSSLRIFNSDDHYIYYCGQEYLKKWSSHHSQQKSPKRSDSEVAWLCLTVCNPMDCGLPGSSIHGIFQARIPEWVAISFSKMQYLDAFSKIIG